MSKTVKKFLSVLLVICTVVSVSIPAFASNNSSYKDDWRYWSQGDSKYSQMKSGCRLVAQAKLLTEAGVPAKSFNPDVYYEYCLKNKYIKSSTDINETKGGISTTGSGMISYAKERGVTMTRVKQISLSSKTASERKAVVWEYIQKGYYVILHCDTHHAYISRVDSLAHGKPMISESTSSLKGGKIYPYGGSYKSKGSSGYEANFTYALIYNVQGKSTNSKNICTIKLNANGGTVSSENVYVNKSGTYGTLPTPTRGGYKFVGWYTKASGGTKINSSTKVTSSHTIYARWEKIPNKISFAIKNTTNITKNSAKVSASCSYSGARPSEVSVYIGTTKSNMKKYSSDKINHTKNPFDIWYNINNLNSDTTYYYQFHATVNGTDKEYGEIKSFTTKKASSTLTMNVKEASKITKNSARVDATCTYTGTRPSEVSVYIGTSKNNMKKYSSDAINHSKNPFNIWYNLSGLKKNTTYYYQFHAKVNGVDKAYGDIKSFKTAK